MKFEEQLSGAFRRGETAIPVKTLNIADVVGQGRRNRRIHFVVTAAGITVAAVMIAAAVGRFVVPQGDPRPPAAGMTPCAETQPSPSSEAEPPLGPGDAEVEAEPTRETVEEAREFASRPDNRADRAVMTWIDFVIEGDEGASWRMLDANVQSEIGRHAWRSIIEKGGLASIYAPFQEPPNSSVHVAREVSSSGDGSIYVVTLAMGGNDAAVAVPVFVPAEGEVKIKAPSRAGVQFLVPSNPGEVVPCDVVFEVMVEGARPDSVDLFIEVSGPSGKLTDFAEEGPGVYTARFAPKEGLESGAHVATLVTTSRDGVAAEATTFTVEGSESP